MSKKNVLKAGRPSEGKSKSIDSLAKGNESMKRVNFELSAELHTKLKIYAVSSGKSIKDVLTEYVETLP